VKKGLLKTLCFIAIAAITVVLLFTGCKTETIPSEEKEENADQEEVIEDAVPDEEKNGDEVLSEEEVLRKKTLYVNGFLSAAPQSFNPLSINPSFPVTAGDVGIVAVYETLFVFNTLTGQLDPLLGTEYEWVDRYTLKISINEDARFSDGHQLTAEDVVYTYELASRYSLPWSQYWMYLDAVSAESEYTVIFKLKEDYYNPVFIKDSLFIVRIIPKHIWEQVEADNDYEISRIWAVFNDDPIGSGPYKVDSYDDTKITLVRDDNYWGTAVFGKLAEPQYIVHPYFTDNAAGNAAFKAGEIDVSHQFIPEVWKMWEDGTPISTYLDEPPYYLPAAIPNIVVNLSRAGLDIPEVRKAIALCIDYSQIAQAAVSGYSDIMVPGIALQLDQELKYIDTQATSPYEYGTDVDAANALLDSIGAEKGADGIRVLPDGTRLGPYEIICPYGWSDWNAAAQIVAICAQGIGIEVRTNFPELAVWINKRAVGDFDMMINAPSIMLSTEQPWWRAYEMLFSMGVAPQGEAAYWNFGRYSNTRVDEILNTIPMVSDEEILKDLYTELDIIYLKDLPTIPLMYRPADFYTVNESIWTGFAKQGDGTGIAPVFPLSGSGIYGLYNIKNK